MALHTPIRLGRDPLERNATLMAIKEHKINRAMALMDERSRAMDLTRPFATRDAFFSASGDHCFSFFDITPLPGVHSVAQVLQVMQFVVKNMEFVISEKLGWTTMREDENDDPDNAAYLHARMVASVGVGIDQDVNVVAFTHYDAEQDVAILVGDSVEEDALYPYQPSCRIRRDVSPTMIVRKAVSAVDGKPVVVVQRIAFTKVHRPTVPGLLQGFEQVCNTSGPLTDMMLSNLLELLRVAPTAHPPAT
ncbi:TPA: hypothetical protein N0F65_010846 [Lagenidium giganteum]|uniref:Uncharacterized protein n=1 Tax=Lagenidium giganteum TaxID=4803 RepID=A0AAV2Z5A5_9STRA|nr:TPA: hypothetical protein N0F65_010846 [Lagenidium giganteum]